MFYLSIAFNQPIDKWNISKVTDMEFMFKDAKSFKQTLPGEWKKKAAGYNWCCLDGEGSSWDIYWLKGSKKTNNLKKRN